MSFEHDAFISYAHLDNKPLPTEKEGWVTIFDLALRQVLGTLSGRDVNVWRDPKLQENDVFSDEILSKFAKTAVLVSVLSPRYLKSEWCIKEIVKFFETAQENHGVVIGTKSRIFKVIKTPLSDDLSFPEPAADLLQEMLGYKFFDLDENNKLMVYDTALGKRAKQEFFDRIYDIAWHISALLSELAGVTSASGEKPAVYLAECANDRSEVRRTIEAELTRLGYRVLPDRELPRKETQFVAEVERLLSKCVLSIHFVGSGYGAVPDGLTDKSVVMLQNEIAVRVSRNGDLKRIISLPANTRGANLTQQTFIDALHSEADLQYGADLITEGTEELKSAIHAALKTLHAKDQGPKTQEKLVYVVCDPRDTLATIQLVKWLRDRGSRVELTKFTGEAAKVREANQELIMNADAIVLFYGAGDEAWKFFQESEITKIRGLRREHPPRMYIYLSGPEAQDKEFILQTETNVIVIDGRNGLPDSLPQLVDD